jgi:hypothetical protein
MDHEEFSIRRLVGEGIDDVLEAEPKTMLELAFLEGLIFGAAARGFEAPAIMAIPLAIDVTHANIATNWPARAVFYTAYGAGVAVAYADKVYSVAAQSIELLK